MYNIVIYDTSNFQDVPIGGQLTSIRNFLNYISEKKPNECSKILLVGITNIQKEVGEIKKIIIGKSQFAFLPILYFENKLDNVTKSLRLSYLKSLFKYRKKIPIKKNMVHYIHTPEAFIQIKMCHPSSKTIIFSHGSFFNMTKGFRFYKDNKLLMWIFNRFIINMIRHADLIFVLDELSLLEYKIYTNKVMKVNNSIVLPKNIKARERYHTPMELLFVGRLSKVKAIDEIIRAVALLKEEVNLTIVGDGEEKEFLFELVEEKNIKKNVKFVGMKKPDEVKEYMKKSDILVMNSVVEGKPMTIIEAISCAMPIISTPVGGIPEIISEKDCIEYTDGTKESILNAIKNVEKNYKEYSKNALELSKRYDHMTVNEKIWNNINKI